MGHPDCSSFAHVPSGARTGGRNVRAPMRCSLHIWPRCHHARESIRSHEQGFFPPLRVPPFRVVNAAAPHPAEPQSTGKRVGSRSHCVPGYPGIVRLRRIARWPGMASASRSNHWMGANREPEHRAYGIRLPAMNQEKGKSRSSRTASVRWMGEPVVPSCATRS